MKKKILVPIIGCLIIFIGIIGFIFWKNRTISTITLDINPSIEINLNKNEKINNIIALNDDAKDILSEDLIGNSLDYTFKILIPKLVKKGYVSKENNIDVILHVDGRISSTDISKKIEFEFGKKDINVEFIIIENITKEDEKLAKEYNISPAKVSYIRTITKENNKININDLANKSVSEIKETKKTGKYCESGYSLEGDWCLKEKERIAATNGEVCPNGYIEYEEKCYKETKSIEGNNYICREGFKLSNDKCIREDVQDAIGKCDFGSYDQGYCIKKEYIGEPTEYCRLTPSTDILMNHKCYGSKPTINGGCLNGDILMSGGCVDMNSYYVADWICIIDGKIQYVNEGDKCYKETKTKPTSYYCEGNEILNGTKCEIKEIEEAQKEKTCPSGYTNIDDGSRCLNFNKSANKESGFVCEGINARLKDNMCIIYEMIEAKSN